MGITPAIIGAVGAIGGGVAGAVGASNAADAQQQAAQQAQQTQLAMYNQMRSDLSPFMSVGTSAISQLASLFGLTPSVASGGGSYGTALAGGPTGSYNLTNDQANALLAARPDVMAEFQRASSTADKNSPAYQQQGLYSPQAYANYWFNHMGGSASYQIPGVNAPAATGATAGGGNGIIPGAAGSSLSQLLTSFPGYQFGLDQGVQALDRAAAAKGLTLSGGQLKDLQSFGTNYALQQAWTPYISELGSLAGLGENAAAGVGNNGLQTGQGVANSQLAGGTAAASGDIGVTNALTSGLQNSLYAYNLYNRPSTFNSGSVDFGLPSATGFPTSGLGTFDSSAVNFFGGQ
jgi:hypothetical protein